MAETIRYLAERGIPVMSHIGLTPQAINMIGGFKPQGRVPRPNGRPSRRTRAPSPSAGAFAVVLEAIAEPLAARITASDRDPTIGIGAGADATARFW